MHVSIGERWESYVNDIVQAGRYGSASEVVREGLRLVEEREKKLNALRETINAAIAEGGAHSSEDVRRHVDSVLNEWEQKRAAR